MRMWTEGKLRLLGESCNIENGDIFIECGEGDFATESIVYVCNKNIVGSLYLSEIRECSDKLEQFEELSQGG